MEYFCKDCKNDGNNTCKFTGAIHTTGIECPSFGIKEKEIEMNFRVRKTYDTQGNWVVADGPDYKCDNYIDHDGTVTNQIIEYTTVYQAQKILDLYLKKQEVSVEVSAPQRTFIGHPDSPTPPIRTLESGAKDTNPKDALGTNKAPLSTLPTGPMYEVALAMLEGARKYGRHNYRVMGVKASVYYDAAMGHITAWWEGEDLDSVSGLHHLAKAMASLAVVRDSEMMDNWVDDRPPRYPNASKLMRNHPAVANILKQYPDCKEPFIQEDIECQAAINHETGDDQ